MNPAAILTLLSNLMERIAELEGQLAQAAKPKAKR